MCPSPKIKCDAHVMIRNPNAVHSFKKPSDLYGVEFNVIISSFVSF